MLSSASPDLCLVASDLNPIKPLRTEDDYRQARSRAQAILGAVPGSPECDELDILGALICAYEEKHFSIPAPVFAESSAEAPVEVWLFHGAGGRFTNGVFSSQTQAEAFINQYRLTGILTKYPVDVNSCDWAIREKLFEPKKPEHYESGFIQRFTTASQTHYHYDPDDLG